MFKIVVTKKIFPEVLAKLAHQCEIKLWEKAAPIPQDTLSEWLHDAEGLFSTGVLINDKLLANAPHLRVIAQTAVGYDNIDIDACTARRIPVGNTPGVLVEATADIAFGLVLNAARRIPDAAQFVKSGQWTSSSRFPLGVDLYGKTLGIVGMGSIGAAVARRAYACGMKIIYYNRHRRTDENSLNATYCAFDELLAQADFILVLVPATAETRGMFGRMQFAAMKNTAYFINVARGSLVDTEALVEALETQQISYAALDVTDPEPLPAGHRLLKLPNVLITPHIGSATIETRMAMAMLAADNLLAGLNKKPLLTCVNESVNYR